MLRLILIKSLVVNLLIFMLAGLSVCAEPLIVGVNETIGEGMPKKVERIKAALKDADLNFDFREYPWERGFQLLAQGDIALNLYLQPRDEIEFIGLLQVRPAVDVLKFWLITHVSTAQLCNIKKNEFSEYMVVGVRGAHFFSDYVYPNFLAYEEVRHFSQMLNMVADQRVDFGLWPKDSIETGLGGHSMDVHICESQPYLTLKFYTYLHKDFSWALPAIKKAYEKHFIVN